MYKQQYTLSQNIRQHFQVLASFIPDGLVLEFNNHKYTYKPFKAFRLSPTFFQSYKCQNCGHCCRRYYLIWDRNTAETLGWTQEKTIDIKINETTSLLYYKPPNLLQKYCVLSEEKNGNPFKKKVFCTQYTQRPLLSRMPHIFPKLNDNLDKVVLSKRKFGRNSYVKCQATYKSKYNFDMDELFNVDIPTLQFVRQILNVYHLDTTVIDKLIDFLKSLDKHKIERIIHRVDGLVIWGEVGRWEQSIEDWNIEYNKKYKRVSLDKYLKR